MSELHSLMVGRERAEDYYLQSRRRAPGEREACSKRGRTRRAALRRLDLCVRDGEILGVAGLVGSGKEELGKVLVGALRRSSGNVEVDGSPQTRDVPFARCGRASATCPRTGSRRA